MWAGSYTIYHQGKQYQIYMGDGQKYEPSKKYYPLFPPQIMADPQEYEHQPEPTPLEEEQEEPVEQEEE